MRTVKELVDLNTMYDRCDVEYKLNGTSDLYLELYEAYRLALIKGL